MRRLLKESDHEAICQRCGICCGSEDGDPCLHLKKDEEGNYHCEIYENRFGLQKTVHNTSFKCVPIEEALRSNPELREKCAYVKILKNAKE